MPDESPLTSNFGRCLISIATHWGSRFGGINSFNADLLSALGLIHTPETRIVCVTLDGNADQIADAIKNHVYLRHLNRPNDSGFSPSLLPELIAVLENAGCPLNGDTVWIGHDIITGPIAIDAAEQTGGKVALIHHMSYADYEAYAETAPEAAAKEQRQRELFSRADALFAVGPLLRDSLQDLQSQPVIMLIPGLAEITTAQTPNTFTGFLSGRIGKDTNRIKQAHLGIAGFAEAIRRAHSDAALPDGLRSDHNPTLKVYGLNVESGTNADGAGAELELKAFSERYAKRVINLRALSFTSNRKTLFDELRRSTLALMPSWHEGFGLVAWEAIAAGVPLVVSQKSGVYRFLKEWKLGLFLQSIYSIDIRGTNVEPFFLPEDLRDVADAIVAIAKNPPEARTRAAQLREDVASHFTWESCARELLLAIGWGQTSTAPSPTPVLPVAHDAHEPLPIDGDDDGLELPQPKWVSGRGLSISQLLRAEEAIVPFDLNRVPFLQKQLTWAKSEEFPIAIRLLAGTGGIGKTRLALELCHKLRNENWRAGFLPDGKRNPSSLQNLEKHLRRTDKPTCVVIDYAETRVSDLVTLVKPLIYLPSSNLIRILLLARSGGEWWAQLEGIDSECEPIFAGRATSGPFEVPSLYDTLIARQNAFLSALDLFANKLSLPKPDRLPDLTAEYYGQPLLVQMAAMMALHGEHAKSAEGLIRGLVNHERRYWASLSVGYSTTADQAAQLMALSTLFNGLQIPRLVEPIWEQAGCGTRRNLTDVFRQLAQLYPGRTGLEGLRPDLIGEALVTQVILSRLGGSLLHAIVANADNRMLHHAWTVFARIIRYRADIMPLLEAALLSQYARNVIPVMEVCCQTPSSLPYILEKAFNRLPNNRKLQVAGQLASSFEDDVLPLNGLAKEVSEVLLLKARKRVDGSRQGGSLDDRAHLAHALTVYSLHLKRIGDVAHALEASHEALGIWSALARANPKRFEGNWAGALNNHSNRLEENGRYEDVLPFAKQALDIYQRLAKDQPKRFEGSLATALNNYALHVSGIGRYEDALPFAEQALEIREQLAANDPKHFEHAWSASLTNYSNILRKNDRHEEALAFSKQALDIDARLAESKPERFEPNLAISLGNYATNLADNERYEDTLSFATEALVIRERLAKSKPERFESDWAGSLGNYANHLSEAGRYNEALGFAKQALDIHDRLADVNPQRFEPDLAVSLSNYVSHLGDNGRYGDAILFANRALAITRRLAQRIPLVYTVDYERIRVLASLIRWLDGSPTNGEIKNMETVDANIMERPEWRGLSFVRRSVASIVAADGSSRVQSAEAALREWDTLSVGVKRDWEDFFFLAASIVDTVSAHAPEGSSAAWKLRYQKTLNRRNGALPRWFSDSTERLGIAL
jgi:glycosyltransferase involved in cell wall biosynthesis